jgi:CRISPR-associated endonuclease/helicase Cas3
MTVTNNQRDRLKLQLEPANIAACLPENLTPEHRLIFCDRALQHQVEVYEAARDHDLILDLAPTGTGKTQAGLSVLHHNRDRNAIYIAPTNALIDQQTAAAAKFVSETGLPHVVKEASAKQIRAWSGDRVGTRSGEKLYNALRETSTMFPECGGGRPLLLVTNPDIFYYATFFAYNRLDRSNIASEFHSSFSTVIFDEFHLYDAKQLVSLLFYLVVSHTFGYFDHGRKVVLLTATPDPACDEALEFLANEGVRLARIEPQNHQNIQTDGSIATLLKPSQTAISLELRPDRDRDATLNAIAAEVLDRLKTRPNETGAVILDSLNAVNQLRDRLKAAGYGQHYGRITGPTPPEKRHRAAQKPVILATSTVDVGFNFEREVDRDRQNLDWLIFSCRDRAAFWQRLGRVGRVLGKAQTDQPSEAIGYLPESAWSDELIAIEPHSGRAALAAQLQQIAALDKPFFKLYWRSEAFLEIAQPLLELEESLQDLPEVSLISCLFDRLSRLFNGRRSWKYYRQRMKIIQGARNILSNIEEKTRKKEKVNPQDCSKAKGGNNCIRAFIQTEYPENYQQLEDGELEYDRLENIILSKPPEIEKLRRFVREYVISYSPLFRFRDSLFDSVSIEDPYGLAIDEGGETNLNFVHLLRYYEFSFDADRAIIMSRAKPSYTLHFQLEVDDLETFKNTQLARLMAFQNCRPIRTTPEGITRSTTIPDNFLPELMPGVIIQEHRKNRWVIARLKKEGNLMGYPIHIKDRYGEPAKGNYYFLPNLAGILAITTAGQALKCPDGEDFFIV